MLTEEMLNTRVLLELTYNCTLCMTMRAALTIIATMSSEPVLKSESNYGSGKEEKLLRTLEPDSVKMILVDEADILLRCAAANRIDEARKL